MRGGVLGQVPEGHMGPSGYSPPVAWTLLPFCHCSSCHVYLLLMLAWLGLAGPQAGGLQVLPAGTAAGHVCLHQACWRLVAGAAIAAAQHVSADVCTVQVASVAGIRPSAQLSAAVRQPCSQSQRMCTVQVTVLPP